jgi:apolipoprotein N-acyltransferase
LSFTPPINAEQGTLTIAAVQGNANAGLFANSIPGSIFKKHLAASSLLTEKPAGQRPDVVIWPENAVDANPLGNANAAIELNDFVSRLDRPLILGTITQTGHELFNSSLLWQPSVGLVDQYDKKRPVPFAEYVPNRDFWARLAPDLIGLIWHDYAFGTRDGIFEVAGTKLGVNICFEIAVDELNRDLVAQGATLIVSQTNNADFGRSAETFQQAELARLRAIETGRAVVNDSTVGVTAVFLPNGETLAQIEPFEPGYLQTTVPLRTSLTPAFFTAPYVELFSAIISFAAICGYAIRAMRLRLARTFRRTESGGEQ